MPYIESEKVAAMRKAIRTALPEYKISVTKHHHSSVSVCILSGPIPTVEHVNVFHYERNLTDRPDAVKVIKTIIDAIFAVSKPKTLVEDGDYGTVPTFYYDVSFGRWDKPYQQTTETAKTTCGQPTLGPDDSIKPCILEPVHTGRFCDSGVR